MTTYYATAGEILTALTVMRPDFTSTGYIDTARHDSAKANVDATLIMLSVSLPVTDLYNLLKEAEINFYLELASQNREIENTFGTLKTDKLGDMTRTYDAGMPMFFFAQGAAQGFMDLLPHETWRMRGYKFVRAYAKASFMSGYSRKIAKPEMATDNTYRGYDHDNNDNALSYSW